MLTKILLITSILLSGIGLKAPANSIDAALIRDKMGAKRVAQASNYNLSVSLPEIKPRPRILPNAPKATANARHYILMDLESGLTLAKEDSSVQVPIASTTKIMTAVVALENYKPDQAMIISQAASTQIGADTFLMPNEKITFENLLNCLLIKSGNDAAYAIAENYNKSDQQGIQPFIDAMNKKAQSLGMKDSFYKDPAGLDVTGYSSAYDLFLVTREALKHDLFREIVIKQNETVTNIDHTIYHELKQSNRLVAEYQYAGAIGVKTGYMPEAGHCLVGAATRDGHTLVAIVLNTYLDTPSASADEARRLLDWGFANVRWQ